MPDFLTKDDVLLIHDRVLALHGGSPGVRDEGLLISALGQPGLEVFGERLHPDVPAQAAAYLYHLARNHPFLDGNKRTALVCALLWLDLNGLAVHLTPDERFGLVVAVAAGQVGKPELVGLLRDRTVPR